MPCLCLCPKWFTKCQRVYSPPQKSCNRRKKTEKITLENRRNFAGIDNPENPNNNQENVAITVNAEMKSSIYNVSTQFEPSSSACSTPFIIQSTSPLSVDDNNNDNNDNMV